MRLKQFVIIRIVTKSNFMCCLIYTVNYKFNCFYIREGSYEKISIIYHIIIVYIN